VRPVFCCVDYGVNDLNWEIELLEHESLDFHNIAHRWAVSGRVVDCWGSLSFHCRWSQECGSGIVKVFEYCRHSLRCVVCLLGSGLYGEEAQVIDSHLQPRNCDLTLLSPRLPCNDARPDKARPYHTSARLKELPLQGHVLLRAGVAIVADKSSRY
jgi:hypothetical protein